MKKTIIGIVSTCSIFIDDNLFNDTYSILNNYVKKIDEFGCVPTAILFNDEKIIYANIDFCDGVIIPGGNRIRPVYLEVIDYCFKKRIPILGICMGMQALALYSVHKSYTKYKEAEDKMLNKLGTEINHWPFDIKRDNKNTIMHPININKDTRLYNILEKEKVEVNSLHNYGINKIGNDFICSATAYDGTIEAIELNNKSYFVLGVQFHPELLDSMDNIFKEFIKESTKRKIQ